jgi:hypothetical protein
MNEEINATNNTTNEVARPSYIPFPCPFCGKKLNEDDVYMNLVSYYYYVRCRKKSCLAEGPARKSWDGAVKAWNKCKANK